MLAFINMRMSFKPSLTFRQACLSVKVCLQCPLYVNKVKPLSPSYPQLPFVEDYESHFAVGRIIISRLICRSVLRSTWPLSQALGEQSPVNISTPSSNPTTREDSVRGDLQDSDSAQEPWGFGWGGWGWLSASFHSSSVLRAGPNFLFEEGFRASRLTRNREKKRKGKDSLSGGEE